MIEPISGLPDNVIAVDCTGQVTRADYEKVLIPLVDSKLKIYEKVRLFYRAGAGFEGIDIGAMYEDAKVGFGHLRQWERAAVVTDIEWIRLAMKGFGFLMPCPFKVFSLVQEPDARHWIAD